MKAMRVREADRVDIVDGVGLRLRCVAAAIHDVELQCTIIEVVDDKPPETASKLVLVQALAKGDADLQAVTVSVELGVDEVIPWQAERSIVRWKPDRESRSHQKWVNAVAAATKQSRRSLSPPVRPLARSTEMLSEQIRESTSQGAIVFVLHESSTVPLASALLGHADKATAREIWCVVGPEGGISDDECEAMAEAGAVPVVLGPTILRAATAGPAALAVLVTRLGRWN